MPLFRLFAFKRKLSYFAFIIHIQTFQPENKNKQNMHEDWKTYTKTKFSQSTKKRIRNTNHRNSPQKFYDSLWFWSIFFIFVFPPPCIYCASGRKKCERLKEGMPFGRCCHLLSFGDASPKRLERSKMCTGLNQLCYLHKILKRWKHKTQRKNTQSNTCANKTQQNRIQ